METSIVYNVFHKIPWGLGVSTYMFLGGVSAGALILSTSLHLFLEKRYQALSKVGAYIAPWPIILGLLILLLELGHPLRFWRLFLSFNPSSIMSWGTLIATIFTCLSLIYVYLWKRGIQEKARMIPILSLIFGIGLGGYTGLLIGVVEARPLWANPLIPFLFLTSAIASGIAATLLFGPKDKELIAKFGKVLALTIGIELFMIITELIVIHNKSPEALETVRLLVSGRFAPFFWGGEIILGLILPIFILARRRVSLITIRFASTLVLFGGFLVRYLIIVGGQVVPLS